MHGIASTPLGWNTLTYHTMGESSARRTKSPIITGEASS